MAIMISFSKKKKAKVIAIGRTLDSLSLLIAMSKSLTEKISKEKNICIEESEKVVLDCIKEGIQVMR